MRRVVVALALAGAWLLAPISAYSDTDLTGLVNTTFLTRTEDPSLHDIAHQRAVEISTDFSHAGRRDGTAEVLAYNGLGAARAVEQWLGSPDHAAILSDPSYQLIGCGSHVVDSVYWAVCVLMAGEPVEVARTPNPTPVGATPTAGATVKPIASQAKLPDTALCDKRPDHWKCQTPTPAPTVAPTPSATASPSPVPTASPSPSPTTTPSEFTFLDDFTGTSLGQHWTGPKCSPFGAETVEWNPARTTVSNGVARISAVRVPGGWSSDLLSTWGHFEQRYGWFEARIKIPEGRGLWPAFWVLERDPVKQCGNGPGELDVMEVLANPEGSERSR